MQIRPVLLHVERCRHGRLYPDGRGYGQRWGDVNLGPVPITVLPPPPPSVRITCPDGEVFHGACQYLDLLGDPILP